MKMTIAAFIAATTEMSILTNPSVATMLRQLAARFE